MRFHKFAEGGGGGDVKRRLPVNFYVAGERARHIEPLTERSGKREGTFTFIVVADVATKWTAINDKVQQGSHL